MANSARSTRGCSVASRAGAIPRIYAETRCYPNRCTKYSRVPDSHSAHSRDDEEYKSEATEAWITQKCCSMSERSNRHSRQRFHTGKHDEQECRYFLRYIHAPSTNKANVVAERYLSLIPVFLAMTLIIIPTFAVGM